MTDRRRFAPATERNREPILEVLRGLLPERGTVLEVASGTGEHAVFLAPHFPLLVWQPSDPDMDARISITAWSAQEKTGNVRPALDLDAAAADWPIAAAEAIVCINMIHISPWAATEGLMRGAGRILPPGAPLYLYGPFRREGEPLAPGNAAFDENLKARDPRWGLRDLEAVEACAKAQGLALERVVEMPANNLSVIFRKR